MSSKTAAMTPSDLQLRAVLNRTLGDRRVAEIIRRPSPCHSSFVLEELDVRLSGGGRLALLFKDVGRLLPGARLAKPAFIFDPLREITVYGRLLAGRSLGTAACYGFRVDRRRGRYWLFLEHVRGRELYQVGRFAVWRHAARWLALLHRRFAAEPGLPALARRAHLVIHDAPLYRRWISRARRFCGARSRRDAQAIAWLAARYGRVVDRLVSLPTTLIHGEFYASNVLAQQVKGKLRICPVDWEMAAIGPGLLDLAALASGWPEPHQQRLAQEYFTALACRQGRTSPDDAWDALQHCRLHLAVQWLGWAPGWSPPPQHARDWLAEALQVAESLRL